MLGHTQNSSEVESPYFYTYSTVYDSQINQPEIRSYTPPILPNWNTSFAVPPVPRGVNAGALALTLFKPDVPPIGPGVLFVPIRFGANSGIKGD
jgi:hypothetical protein